MKVRDRLSYAFALASCAAGVEIADGKVRAARIALGGVGTRPWKCAEAEQALIGQPAQADTFRKAAEVALREAKARRDNGFKIELAKRTLVRALSLSAEAA